MDIVRNVIYFPNIWEMSLAQSLHKIWITSNILSFALADWIWACLKKDLSWYYSVEIRDGHVNRQHIYVLCPSSQKDPDYLSHSERESCWFGNLKKQAVSLTSPHHFECHMKRAAKGPNWKVRWGPALSGSNKMEPLISYAMTIKEWLNDYFPNWIGRCGHVKGSLDISLLDFFFSGVCSGRRCTQ